MLHATAAKRRFALSASAVPWRHSGRGNGKNRPSGNIAAFHRSPVAWAEAEAEALCMPHSHISATKDSEKFLLRLLDRLWDKYRARVSYVQTYEEIVKSQKATFVNDHIAFRSIALQSQRTGIPSVSRIFEALGYRAAATYTAEVGEKYVRDWFGRGQFEDKHLSAIHFEHPRAIFPKLFISELKMWELGASARDACLSTVASHTAHVTDALLADLHAVGANTSPGSESTLEAAAAAILELPWEVPEEEAVRALHAESQYGAWVLAHGYNVNHFTALVNSHGVARLNDIESTVQALKANGVPMKAQIESDAEGRLRQTATEAVNIPVPMRRNGAVTEVEWPYAYFELAQRDPYKDVATGELTRFEGFLSANATHLFDMTTPK